MLPKLTVFRAYWPDKEIFSLSIDVEGDFETTSKEYAVAACCKMAFVDAGDPPDWVMTCKVPPLITKVSMAGFGAGRGAPKKVSKDDVSLILMKS